MTTMPADYDRNADWLPGEQRDPRTDTHAELMAKWAATTAYCTCQSHYTDALQCKRHGAMLREKGTK